MGMCELYIALEILKEDTDPTDKDWMEIKREVDEAIVCWTRYEDNPTPLNAARAIKAESVAFKVWPGDPSQRELVRQVVQEVINNNALEVMCS